MAVRLLPRERCRPVSAPSSQSATASFVAMRSISYQSRETEGTQTPIETLYRGWGSCRDLAMLLIEAARSLGFG
ncbi:MAG: transglutaminase family protein, partial [Xanthobacteraceae bacterium]